MNAEAFPVKKREGMIILQAVGLCAGLVICREIAPSLLSAFPVVHANIHRLPVKLLPTSLAPGGSHNREENPVDPGGAGYFPRTSDQFGVFRRNLRFSRRGTQETVYEENAHETQHKH